MLEYLILAVVVSDFVVNVWTLTHARRPKPPLGRVK